MKLDAFDYSLPAEKIATKPADPRGSARLLDLSVLALPTAILVICQHCFVQVMF